MVEGKVVEDAVCKAEVKISEMCLGEDEDLELYLGMELMTKMDL